MSNKIIILDLETVPRPLGDTELQDYMASWKPKGNVSKPETIEKHREQAESDYIDKRWKKYYGSKIICAGLGLIVDNEVSGIETYAGEDSEDITIKVCEYLSDCAPYTLVTYNGKRFDLPIFAYHVIKAKCDLVAFSWHVDLMEEMKNRMGSTSGGLKGACERLGIEKKTGTDGSQVKDLFDTGKWAEIKEYQEDDVRMTGELAIALNKVFPLFRK